MLRRSWKPIAGATVLVGAPSYLYYTYAGRATPQQSFDLAVRVRGPDGKRAVESRSYPLLSKHDVDARIASGAHTHTRRVAAGPAAGTWTCTTASLAANPTLEDAHASAALSPAHTAHGPASDLLFFAVMDGHGGYHTSRLL